MPAVVGTDEELAGALTYVRREWGHAADPVPVETIRALRQALKTRKQPFTAAELKELDGH